MGALVTDPLGFFSDYLRVTGVVHIGAEKGNSAPLEGKRLGLLNGSSWITLWSTYFARLYLPGVQLLNMGNDAVQFNFMKAHDAQQECPPLANVERFVQYARDLVELGNVDAVLITCSTMNRSHARVADALRPSGVPVVQIDGPMMEAAMDFGDGILVVATHGPTVASTHALLDETAARRGRRITKYGLVVEGAWRELALGNVEAHNQALASAIRGKLRERSFSCVVLAQLSMAALLFTFPDLTKEFGLPVLTSAQQGFQRVRKILESSADAP